MAKRKGAAIKGPVALVGSVSGRRGGGSRGSRRRLAPTVVKGAGTLAGRARALPRGIEKVVAGPLPKPIAKRLPSRRKRRALVKRVKRDMDRLASLAGGVSTALGLAAAAAEIVSAARGQGDERERAQGSRQRAEEPEDGGQPEDVAEGDDHESDEYDEDDDSDVYDDEAEDDDGEGGDDGLDSSDEYDGSEEYEDVDQT